ncbi:MAG: PDZ domain-containing protein, partial [Thermodesulfovibrionales bacterium]|jgi:serine protease Do
VNIKIVRNGETMNLKLTVGEFPADKAVAVLKMDNALKGVSVQDLTDELLQKFSITKKLKGVVVNNIEQESPASGILTNGDIILEVNRKALSSAAEYTDLVSRIEKGQDILLLIVRGGNYLYITVPGR